ncbi:FAD-dependent oxidoreductase [Brenneria izbisi]|uniref:FAD-dependent oxidoreductase n=1 Tax=Brenneria izbisi TaxID=2939450 RepID=A0AA42C386_9GAMM|nr:FAD-dependent oxidoreductase [Brenneria izbisi]MCV9878570.1 FAD-dependent oxidoreductase [Brenneria izbisi]MCV9882247.1 FAD-dependent oxidoreductase [Brenneria izbisi]
MITKNRVNTGRWRLAIMLLICGMMGSAQAAITAGQYSATEKGNEGMVSVTVTIDEQGVIKDIAVDASQETPELGGEAGPAVGRAIVEHQSLAVDGVTGATMTSNAVKKAVSEALRQAGADVTRYQGKVARQGQDEETRVDVVVVGGGVSGTAAALAAVEKGAQVLVIEKMPVLGGAGRMASGFTAVESSLQKAKGMKYTAAELTQRLLEYNQYLSNGPLTKKIVDKSASTVDWMIKHGVELEIVATTREAKQSSVQQAHLDDPIKSDVYHRIKNGGEAAYKTLYAEFEKLGGKVMTKTIGKSLMQDDQGNVIGLIAEKADGGKLTVHAKAVILASGGFGANKAMLDEVMMTSNIFPLAWPNMGEGVKMAWAAGGAKWDVQSALIHAAQLVGIEPSEEAHHGGGDEAKGDSPLIWLLKSPLLWVDAVGERFANEGHIYDTAFWANVAYSVGGNYYIIVDTPTLKSFTANAMPFPLSGAGPANPPKPGDFVALADEAAKQGKSDTVFKGKDIGELAARMGIAPDGLQATVARYNGYVKAKQDKDFGKKPEYLAYGIEKGPFYAFKAVVVSLSSLGGVRVNSDLQVTDVNLRPIAGLYAVGNNAAGFYSVPGYPPYQGLANGFALNSGRIAGEHAAQSILKK